MSIGFDNDLSSSLAVSASGVGRDEDALPASFAQERMWFFERIDGATPAYNMPAALELRGSLDPASLCRAIEETIARHESLRTRFLEIDGQLMQVVSSSTPKVNLPIVDLTDRSVDVSEQIRSRLAADANTPFDLSVKPPIRFRLFRIGDRLHVFYVCMHHIVSDGWSFGILIREVTARYAAYVNGGCINFDELPIQYADYAVWQRERVAQTPDAYGDPAYWRACLEGLPPKLDLPTDAPRPRKLSGRGGWHVTTLCETTGRNLAHVSRVHGVTPFMMMLAVFGLFLMRISGQRDIGVGTTIAGRTQPQLQSVIGLFVNTIVLRLQADRDQSFSRWLQQVKGVCVGGYAHQEWPFDRVVAAVRPERSLAFLPLFQVMFSMQGVPRTDFAMPGLSVARVPVAPDASKFDLALDVEETDDGLILSWEYSTDLFDATTIAHWATSYEFLLAAALNDPEQRMSALPLLPDAWRTESEAVAPQHAGVSDESFDARVRRLCHESPDTIAVEDDTRALSYREFDAFVDRIAHALRCWGVANGELIGCCLEHGVRVPAVVLGILRAGGACVPLTPERAASRMSELTARNSLRRVFVEATTEPLLAASGAQRLRIELCEDDSGSPDMEAAARLRPSQAAYVVFASRTHAGRPMGLTIEHRNLCAASDAWCAILASGAVGCRWMQIADMDSATFLADLLRTLGTGGTMVMAAPSALTDAASLTDWLVSRRIDAAAFAPAVLRELFRHWTRTGVPAGVPSLVVVDSAAGRWHGDDHARARALLGDMVRVISVYSALETGACASFDGTVDLRTTGRMPIGQALPGSQLYVLDDALQPTTVGATGELCIGGTAVARGYLNSPARTAETFVADRFGGRLYRTGDLARLRPDGAIELVSQVGDALMLRGLRISRGYVEEALLRRSGVWHAEVAVCEPRPGNPELVAYLVSDVGEWVPSRWRHELKQVLPEHMVPSVWVRLDEPPRLAGGTLQLRRPALLASGREPAFVRPQTLNERLLAELWKALLGRVDPISIDDHFFDLGGDSLLAVQFAGRLKQDHRIDLPVTAIFDEPTLRALANRIDSLPTVVLS